MPATKCSPSSAAACAASASRSCLEIALPSASRRTIQSGASSLSARASQENQDLNSNTTDRHPKPSSPRRGWRGGGRGAHKPAHVHAPKTTRSRPTLEPIDVDTAPVPFASLGLDIRLLQGTRDLGWVDTRPIQTAVIPLALANHDLIACANTGTGKTAAFVVPTLQRLLSADLEIRPGPAPVPPDTQGAVAKAFGVQDFTPAPPVV